MNTIKTNCCNGQFSELIIYSPSTLVSFMTLTNGKDMYAPLSLLVLLSISASNLWDLRPFCRWFCLSGFSHSLRICLFRWPTIHAQDWSRFAVVGENERGMKEWYHLNISQITKPGRGYIMVSVPCLSSEFLVYLLYANHIFLFYRKQATDPYYSTHFLKLKIHFSEYR